MRAPTDGFGRKIDYLRLSVTDRCNLRCVYCLPEFYQGQSPPAEVLTDGEVVRLAEIFSGLGFSKIRITGGEPLVRPGLPELIRGIAGVPGVSDIALSTNGTLLPALAEDLARSGLKRVNVSLDSLRPDRFAAITRRGKLASVLEGVEAALAAGLSPVKINVVVVRGMNEDEIPDFVRLARDRPLHVRFIELMPMGETGFFTPERRVPLEEILERAGGLQPLPPVDWPRGHGPARYYRQEGARGTVGVISALSCGFCSSCNRVRLSARGSLVPCLDGAEGADLRTPLRAGAGPDALKEMILQVIRKKPERHFMLERSESPSAGANPRFMCQVGG
ncbi:MAG: GTP 3',8-cyclase MoaA [Elusimicrobiota bacterium]